MYLYSVAYSLLRHENISVNMKYGTMLVFADSLAEALGMALQNIRDKYPVNDGWYRHDVEGFAVDNSIIERAYRQLNRQTERLG